MQVRGVYLTGILALAIIVYCRKVNFLYFLFLDDSKSSGKLGKDVSSVRIAIVGYCVVIRSTVMLVDPERKKKIDTLNSM